MATSKTTNKAPAKKPAAKAAAPTPAPKAKNAPAPVHFETPSGFKMDLNPSMWDDMELLDLFVEMTTGNDARAGMAVPQILAKIFSPEEKRTYYDHIRTSDGRVPLSIVSSDIVAIISGLGGEEKK